MKSQYKKFSWCFGRGKRNSRASGGRCYANLQSFEHFRRLIFSLLAVATLTLSPCAVFSASAELTVLTDRATSDFAKAAAAFEGQTRVKVKIVEKPFPELLALLRQRQGKGATGDSTKTPTVNAQDPGAGAGITTGTGAETGADVIITKDLANLHTLKMTNLLVPMQSNEQVKAVPQGLRDVDLSWVGLTYRVRTAVYSTETNRVDPQQLSTYARLGDPEWQGRLCLRTGSSSYNEALVADLLLSYGETATEAIVAGWVKNSATNTFFTGDNAILDAIVRGVCDVGIVNSYYLGIRLNQTPGVPLAIAFLDQDNSSGLGVHSNGTGGGIAAGSPNQKLAQAFLETLLQPEMLRTFADAHFEYPAIANVPPTTLIASWGALTLSPNSWTEIAQRLSGARSLIQRLGFF